MDTRLCFLVVLCVLISGAVGDALRISNVLGSNMVLQRDVEARIWGWATPNYNIVVSLSSGEKYQATADSTGAWLATLSPHEAGGPYNITVEDQANNVVDILNVLFGDVWVCSGQSNMEFIMSWAFNSTAEIADTVNYPNIRVLNVGDGNVSSTPQQELITLQTPWSVPSPSFMGGFSAVCWFHARNIYQTLGVPLGLIGSNWGGTIIEAWSSPDALAKCAGRSLATTVGGPNPNVNSVLWNAMIYPLLPTAIFGVLWYQGEQNTFEPTVYGCREVALIIDWRAKFGTEFVFNFVQLAPWSGNENSNVGTDVPDTRVAQLQGLSQPRVGFATAVDLGDSLSPYNDIHPRYKQEVGKRLATTTLAVAFGANVTWIPPAVMKGATVNSYPNLTFALAIENTGSGLTFINNTCPSNVPASNCSNFAVQLSDGNTYPAVGEIIDSTNVQVSLPNPNKLQPKILYYGYSSWPVLTIFRKDDGYPLLPFKLVST